MRRLIRFLMLLVVAAAVVGAVAVAFIDLPAPQAAISAPVEIEGLKKEIERAQ